MNAFRIKTTIFRIFVLLTFPIGSIVIFVIGALGYRKTTRRRKMRERGRELAGRTI